MCVKQKRKEESEVRKERRYGKSKELIAHCGVVEDRKNKVKAEEKKKENEKKKGEEKTEEGKKC